jgi:hypothetical protein
MYMPQPSSANTRVAVNATTTQRGSSSPVGMRCDAIGAVARLTPTTAASCHQIRWVAIDTIARTAGPLAAPENVATTSTAITTTKGERRR